jgi:hypothetical protein
MAIRAADLALLDLGIDRGHAAAVPSQSGHGVALVANVIELEHDDIVLAAVSARTAREDLVKMREVASDWRGRVRAVALFRSGSPPARPSSGPAPVAVCAHDLTSGDLGVDGCERRGLGDQCADSRDLLADVVELQDDRILLPAIDATALGEVIENMGLQGAMTTALRRLWLLAMKIAASAEVRSEARPAIRLVTFPHAVEELERQLVATPAAPTQFARLPDVQRANR